MRLVAAVLVILAGLLIEAPAIADDEFVDMVGKDLDGWVVEGVKQIKVEGKPAPVWTVQDGVITCAAGGEYGFLRYDKKFSDFILRAEYRIQSGGNSGVGIRTPPYTGMAETRPSAAAYEIQILDDAGKPPDDHGNMSLYGYRAPTVNVARPAGEWNELEIDCQGPKIKITLNGQVVQDVDQSTFEAIKDKPLSGYISLQNHNTHVEWRKLRIKKVGSK